MSLLSFFPRKCALFTAGSVAAQPLRVGFDPGTGGFSVAAAPDGAMPLYLVFGPLWLSAYGPEGLIDRFIRPDPAAAYSLTLAADVAGKALDLDDTLAGLEAGIPFRPDILDLGQLALLAGAAERALAIAGGQPASAYADLLKEKALRQAFQARKEAAMQAAAGGDRARGLDLMADAVSLYDRPAAAPRVRRREGPVITLADLSLPQCRHYRVDQKQEQLAALGQPHQAYDQADDAAFLAAVPGARLAIFYRVPFTPRIAAAIGACRQAGVPCLYEIDDLLFEAAAFPAAHETYGADLDTREYAELQILPPLYLAALKACDGAIASTPALAAEMRRHLAGQPVFIHANGLGQRHLVAMENQLLATAGRPVRLFYGSGTRALQADFDLLAETVLAPTLAARPALELALGGHCDLPACLQPHGRRIVRLGLLPVGDYWRQLAACDINLAPLMPSRFNDCKSLIKWLEAAMFGVPTVAAATATSRALLQHESDAMICKTAADWRAALDALTVDPARRRAMGEAARTRATGLYSPEILEKNLKAILDAVS